MLEIKNVCIIWLSKIILKIVNRDVAAAFRNIERILVRLTKTRYHLRFNESCIQHELLPTFTNIKLYDEAARPQTFVLDFRRKLIQHESKNHKAKIIELENEYAQQLQIMKKSMSSIRFEALQVFLHRTIAKLENDLSMKHNSKLCSIYGGTLCQKETRDSFVNLSDCTITDDIKNIFSLGMNCHLKSKYNFTKQKIEIEKLYESIEEKAVSRDIIIQDEEMLSVS